MTSALRSFVWILLLCGLALGGDASPASPDLKRAYPKGAEGQWRLGLVVDDLLERDSWSTGEWKECRVRKLDWVFRISWKVHQATTKGFLFEATLLEFTGTLTDRAPDDPARREVQAILPAAEAKGDAWTQGLAGLQGTYFRFEVGPRGGVSRVAGLSASAAKAFQRLSAGKDTKALARDLSAWFSDEAWVALLDSLLAPCQEGQESWKSEQGVPLLSLSREFGAQALPRLPAAFRTASADGGVAVSSSFEAGKVDEMLQFIGQPGFHSLGTEQKGECRAVYGGAGLREAQAAFTVHDRWDNYRMNSKADRFDRHATLGIRVEAVQ